MIVSLPSTIPDGSNRVKVKALDELLERHAVLQAHRDRDREIVHQRAKGRALLVHVDKELGEPAVLVLAGAQIDLVAADRGLLRVAFAPVGQPSALAALHHALDHPLDEPFDDPLGDQRRALGRRLREQLGCAVLGLLVVAEQARGQGLREFRAVAIKRGRLQAEPPRQQVGGLAILDRRRVRHVDRLRDRARDEGLRRRHHPDVAFGRQRAGAGAPARAGAIEHRQMLGLQMRRAFQGHRPAAPGVGGVDLGPAEAERGQQVETRIVERCRRDPESLGAEGFAQGPFVEREFDVERGGERGLGGGQRAVVEPLGPQGLMVDRGRAGQGAVAQRIALDRGDLGGVIAERRQRLRHRAVDDLEIAAAGELLEFDQREIGFDAGRVAIHDQADRAGGRDDRRLGVAETVLLAKRQGRVPAPSRRCDQQHIRAVRGIERDRQDRQPLIAGSVAMSRRGGGCARPAASPRGSAQSRERRRAASRGSPAISAEVA